MERNDIHQRIGYLRGEIAALQKENLATRNLIDRLETDEVSISVLENRINIFISECIDTLKHATPTVDNYAVILKGILTGNDAKNLCDGARSLGTRVRAEIDALEEAIKNNNLQICRYQVDIDEIEALKSNDSLAAESVIDCM